MVTSSIDGAIDSRNKNLYPSPFLDMTSIYMPRTIKEMFKYINEALYSDPIVSQVISKLSEYPITNLIYSDSGESVNSEKVEKRWKKILEDSMDIDSAMKTCGMDYYGYGTSLVSINFPFKRMLKCKSCHSEQSVESDKTKYTGGEFVSTCKSCGHKGSMDARDMPTKEINKLGFVFWDLMQIHIKYNNISGDHFFYYTIPQNIRKSVNSGDMDIINTTRIEVIEAVKKNKKIKLSKLNLFHYKRPGPQLLASDQRGWGVSVVMPVLKEIFYKRLLKKGNEAIAFEHIVPLRIIFPQGSGEVTPHSMVNLGTWREKIETEILKWKRDPNRISIVPLPVGQINFGGDGKMLMVTNEVKAVDDSIIIGTGVIPEIIKGGASWSGSNVSLRVVENTFLNHRKSMQGFISWAKGHISRYFDIPEIDITMDDFKMADDIQRKQMLMQAASQSQMSFDTALKEMGLDPDTEYKNMLEEIKKQTEILTRKSEGQAESQGAASIISQMYNVDAQFEAKSRSEMHTNNEAQKAEKQKQEGIAARSQQAAQETEQIAQGQGVESGKINTADFIMLMTRRFAHLSKVDTEDFKIRMLSMKNNTPSLYQEVYNNLAEMNIIEADLNPNIDMANKYTPGELPTYTQGDNSSSNITQTADSGGTVDNVNKQPKIKPLPEQRPPRGVNASV